MVAANNSDFGRILVVDDNADVNRALGTLLRKEGFEPITFQAGIPALQFAHRDEFDAALIDIHLPDMSGLDLARDLRDRFGNDLPIIVVSGDNSIETLRALPKVGATYFFAKPVNPTILISRLKEWVIKRELPA
jgi:DNA-binding response OmpR family regulator